MSEELLLALDLGTTGVRALVVSAEGETLARAYRSLSTVYPSPGWVEQDPADMWDRSVEVMREALAGCGRGADALAGIGVTTQRGTALAWDGRTQEPLGAAISWQDERTKERVAVFRKMGVPLNTFAAATKFEWWLANEPAVKKAAEAGTLRLGTPDCWLSTRLTGGAQHVTDPGNAASTALYDPAAGQWSELVMGVFGVSVEALPSVVPTNRVIGETPGSLLGAPVPVAARAGDQQASAFGQGIFQSGQAKLTLGTSAMLDLNTGGELRDPLPGTYALPLWKLDDGAEAFCLEGSVVTAGAAVDWGVGLGLASDPASLDKLAEGCESTGGVHFVPALQGLGTPFLDPEVCGLLGGVTRGTGRAEIARALLEGVAQRCVDVADALQIGSIPLNVDGGLSRSALLLQMIADRSGLELRRAVESETSALGAALLAGLATGIYADPSECAAVRASPESVQPRWDESRRAESRALWARIMESATRQ